MTYKQVIQKMDGKTFHSESFGEESVTVNGVEVSGDSGRLHLLSSAKDVSDLYADYLKGKK